MNIVDLLKSILFVFNSFFLVYLIVYSTFLFLSSIIGSLILYRNSNYRKLRNELKDDYYVPVSIIVPAYNEELTIIETVKSLLNLHYKLFEIVVVDDGSRDDTSKKLIDYYSMIEIKIPIKKEIECKNILKVYEKIVNNIKIVLIIKENGGKADSLNAGINIASYPYFTCMDADSMLQVDALEKIVKPVLEDSNVIACGGNVRISNGVKLKNGKVVDYHLPNKILDSMQVLEYDRSFLASRILFDQFNGNLIISGAFGLFKKNIVIAAGGYDASTVGEDFELVIKLHVFCRMHKIKYSIKYVSDAVCWSQAPDSFANLFRQRKRWNKGLLQGMIKYKELFLNPKYGMVSFVSFLYFLVYELFSPFIELIGIITVIISFLLNLLNIKFMLMFMGIYIVFNSFLSFSIFLSRLHVENIKLSVYDFWKALLLSIFEITILRFIILTARFSAFIGYNKQKYVWDRVERKKIEYK
ncbi:MAG: glycosyltransferase family 2 protein [Bacilli bacterium]|nr:glycosyltransferase family 2 protein [Bacilli bacterium]